MNVTTQDEAVKTAELQARNEAVEKAFYQIIKGASNLLSPFEGKKYRTLITIDHSDSGRETNLICESLCFFWNITLTMNKMGYKMIYFCPDEESISKFGQRLTNRAMRQLFKCTMQEKNKPNIEDCIRINNPGKVQSFFLSRLANGDNDFITITEVEFQSPN